MVMMMRGLFVLCLFSFWVFPLCSAGPPYKSVNLGGWFVIEGWMTPWLFDGIPNKDLLDGTQVQLQSVKLQRYLSSNDGGGAAVVADRPSASDWETFTLWRVNETTFNLRVFNKQFVGFKGNEVVAVAGEPGVSETFQIERKEGGNLVRFRGSNGSYLQAKGETLVTAAEFGSSNGSISWEYNDPTVFNMTIVGSLQGQYQVVNGYGPERAQVVMQNHWDTYITEGDFQNISAVGLDAVRIPVGWWMAYDPSPPKPYVGGALKVLDNAFSWAEKYGLKVIIDLHAIKHSQNGNPHSSSRDGSKEWNASHINETVDVIEILTARYAKSPVLVAMELMNEPNAPWVTFDDLNAYYKAAYAVVRKYSSDVYVILSNRLGHPMDPKEFLSFQGDRVVVDVHYYNLFVDWFRTMTPQQNIDFVVNNRSGDLAKVTTPGGPLTFVGEWVNDWEVKNATKEEMQRFSLAQQKVYGKATFGWAYWAYRCIQPHWSIEYMIKNGYMSLL